MKITFKINYRTSWAEQVCVLGSIPELGSETETNAVPMTCTEDGNWELQIKTAAQQFKYYYLIKSGATVVRAESMNCHEVCLPKKKEVLLCDAWKDNEAERAFKSKAFAETIYNRKVQTHKEANYSKSIIFRVNASVTNKGESVRYWRSGLRNDMQQCNWYLEPSALFRYSNKSEQSLWLLDNIYFNYDCNVQTPNPVQMLNIEDTSNPLAITKGNPNLKVARNHSIYLNLNNKPWDKYFGISINMNFLDNMVANGFTYNPLTGVYTYRPENVKGNWKAFVGSLYRKALNKSQSIFMESRTSFNYAHNVDLAQVEGFNTSQLSRVNHYTTSQNLKVAYNKETTRVELIGDFSWNVAVREHMNTNNINAFNFSYGISGQYTFPWKIQLATDLRMYSRRGYEEPSMNTNEPVWNASLSRPFMKGNLIVKVDAFDILNQLSNTRYIVNGQGRTETWQLMRPRYAMLRIAYRFNKMPKKQK